MYYKGSIDLYISLDNESYLPLSLEALALAAITEVSKTSGRLG